MANKKKLLILDFDNTLFDWVSRSLHCLDAFGRQLICALKGLHPQAVLAFADRDVPQAA